MLWARPAPEGGQSTLSADGSLLVETSRLAITLYHTDTGEPIWSVEQEPPRPDAGRHDADFNAAFSPDGSLLATTSISEEWADPETGAARCDVALRELATGAIVRSLKATPCKPAWSPEGRFLAAYEDARWGGGEIWETASGERVMSFDGEFDRWSPNGTQFSARPITEDRQDTLITLLALTTGQTVATLDQKIGHVVWSPDGQIVAAIEKDDYMAHLLDAGTGQEIKQVQIGRFDSITWSADNRLLGVRSTGGEMDIVDREARQTALPLSSPPATGSPNVGGAMDWSPDGRTLYIQQYDGGIAAWDTQTGALLRQMDEVDEVTGLAFSPKGMLLAAAYQNGSVILWDTLTRKPLRSLDPGDQFDEITASLGWRPNVDNLAWSPDGTRLAGPRGYGVGQVWDIATGQTIKQLYLGANSRVHVDWSPDGRYLAAHTGEDEGSVIVFDALTWEEARRFDYSGRVTSLKWLPGGPLLAVSTYVDNTFVLDIYNVETGELEPRPDSPKAGPFAWSPDGTRALFGDELWDIRTWTRTASLPDDLSWEWQLAAWSPQPLGAHPGLELIAATAQTPGLQGDFTLLDASTGEALAAASRQPGWITQLAWSPDGKTLATGTWDGTILLWDVAKLIEGKR